MSLLFSKALILGRYIQLIPHHISGRLKSSLPASEKKLLKGILGGPVAPIEEVVLPNLYDTNYTPS